jgi:glucose-1-phosphate thymidylyltransferase
VGWVFVKEVPDPHRFGVATISEDPWQAHLVLDIEEKPHNPKTNYAVTGLYLYDHHVWEFIRQCSPSERNELEITDVNKHYIRTGFLYYSKLLGFWKDAGTFDSLIEAGKYWADRPSDK